LCRGGLRTANSREKRAAGSPRVWETRPWQKGREERKKENPAESSKNIQGVPGKRARRNIKQKKEKTEHTRSSGRDPTKPESAIYLGFGRAVQECRNESTKPAIHPKPTGLRKAVRRRGIQKKVQDGRGIKSK